MKRLLGLLGFAGLAAGAVVVGATATARGKNRDGWYRRLDKPSFTPPDWVFGPVWTTIYALMATSAYRVWRGEPTPERQKALLAWTAQLALNAAWSPLFFGAHKPRVAFADLALLIAALGAYTSFARRVDRPAAWMVAPYIGWTAYAGALNGSIALKN